MRGWRLRHRSSVAPQAEEQRLMAPFCSMRSISDRLRKIFCASFVRCTGFDQI
jgi:hypothetical protein